MTKGLNTLGNTVDPLYLPIQPTLFQQIFWGKKYVVVDMYYVVRPVMTVSIVNVYRLLLLSLFTKQFCITTSYIAFTLF